MSCRSLHGLTWSVILTVTRSHLERHPDRYVVSPGTVGTKEDRRHWAMKEQVLAPGASSCLWEQVLECCSRADRRYWAPQKQLLAPGADSGALQGQVQTPGAGSGAAAGTTVGSLQLQQASGNVPGGSRNALGGSGRLQERSSRLPGSSRKLQERSGRLQEDSRRLREPPGSSKSFQVGSREASGAPLELRKQVQERYRSQERRGRAQPAVPGTLQGSRDTPGTHERSQPRDRKH